MLRTTFLTSKNNIDVFNIFSVRTRLIGLYSSFRWVNSSRLLLSFYKNIKLMFASHTPVFAHLMNWAGLLSNGVSSSNRWLTGRISAHTKIRFLPNYLFIPDPDENHMITKETRKKKIPIVSFNNSDSQFLADIGIYGNNRSFKLIFKLVQLLIKLAKNKKKAAHLILENKTFVKKPNWFILASQKK